MVDPLVFERVCAVFDASWYAGRVNLASDETALSHFLTFGWNEGLAPGPFFDPQWYLRQNPDVAAVSANPLKHYIEYGEAEGRWPCRLLDPAWYGRTHGLQPGGAVCLEHYDRIGSKQGLKPNAIFDPSFYLQNNSDLPRDLRFAAIHYVEFGFREQRLASSEFSSIWYRKTYLNEDSEADPIHHYLRAGRLAGFRKQVTELNFAAREVRRFAAPGPDFEEFDKTIARSAPARAKVVAFYLPQFHPIPENDEWWGAGFTEWNNVARASPRFIGHYQPRIPRDLGFYDLTRPDVMERQIELAKAAGIHAFCFYYYLFGQRKILEKPLDHLLADRNLDMPFCLMWANENWTRRWDGQESEILLAQHYDLRDDDYLLESLVPYMEDPRYLRVQGRPLFFIYRPALIPNLGDRVARWRRRFKERFGLEPWLMMAQTFDDHDPSLYGLDGAVEFPPHKLSPKLAPLPVELLDYDFSGQALDYAATVEASLSFPVPAFPLIKTAFPSWDNDARRQGAGTSFTNSTPALYQAWLTKLIEYARQNRFAGESLVFVNAWNEWAEGAYLEPDVHFGSAYLNATARAVVGKTRAASSGKMKVLLVGHDAHEHGAQMTLLNLGRTFVQRFGVDVCFLLLEGGRLLSEYQKLGRVDISRPGDPRYAGILQELHAQGFTLALTNTVVAGAVIPDLLRIGCKVVSLVHEMPRLIREYEIQGAATAIATGAAVVVFPAPMVRDAFGEIATVGSDAAVILPQGLYAPMTEAGDCRSEIRAELGISPNARIVLGVGYADLRKGIDLFLETARKALQQESDLVFVWVGRVERSASIWLVEKGSAASNVRLVDFSDNIGRYFDAADVFYLTSREDPFPSTVLEALAHGQPVVGFAGCTGSADLISRFGRLVPAYAAEDALLAINALIDSNCDDLKSQRRLAIATEYRWDNYAFQLLQCLDPSLKRVSVAIPNYNYAPYLRGRIESVFNQSYPIFEILVLDDASSDASIDVLHGLETSSKREFRLIRNSVNSGSIMSQWSKAASEASGDYLWIAEADDLALPDFVRSLANAFTQDTLFAFSDSSQIDENGDFLGATYTSYLQRFCGDAFRRDFLADATVFARNYLATANIILNVSGVLFRRKAVAEVLSTQGIELRSYRFAGDWVVYLTLCTRRGLVAYVNKPLNSHRRHASSATHATALETHAEEIRRVHGVFGRLFGIDGAVRAAQQGYRSEVRKQFALADEAAE